LNAKNEIAGKRVKCPSCGQVILVPAAPTSQLESPKSSPEKLPAARTKKPTATAPPVPQIRRIHWPWYVGGGAATLCLLVVVVFIIAQLRKERTPAQNDTAAVAESAAKPEPLPAAKPELQPAAGHKPARGTVNLEGAIRLARNRPGPDEKDDSPFFKARLGNAGVVDVGHLGKLTGSAGMPLLQSVFQASNEFCTNDSEGFNEAATPAAFAAAIKNLDEKRLVAALHLLGAEDTPPSRLVVFVLLVGSSGAFVQGPGNVNTKAANAAFDYMTPEILAVATRLAESDGKVGALYALLRSASFYIDDNGVFDATAFTQTLKNVTSEHMRAVMAEMKPPNDVMALTILMKASNSSDQGRNNPKPQGSIPGRQPGEVITNSLGMKFAFIPAGTFLMGSPESEAGRNTNEGPQHKVEITRPFYLGIHPVTQGQWQRVMGNNPSFFCSSGDGKDKVLGLDTTDFPVESISWNDCQEFIRKVSELPEEKRSERGYRLPTEAEWEYTCRGGASAYQVYAFGNSLATSQANFNNVLGRTCKVGSYQPNGFGLYDMHGNVFQWCVDRYDKSYYVFCMQQKDPGGPVFGLLRVIRGGGWNFDPLHCRSAFRFGYEPGYRYYDLGCRLVLVSLPGKSWLSRQPRSLERRPAGGDGASGVVSR
jgi:formylglycine-generating enzyme required for sulfatase activity